MTPASSRASWTAYRELALTWSSAAAALLVLSSLAAAAEAQASSGSRSSAPDAERLVAACVSGRQGSLDVRVCTNAVEAARVAGRRDLEGAALAVRAGLLSWAARFDEGIADGAAALRVLEGRTADPAFRWAHLTLGALHRERGDPAQALDHTARAIELALQAGDPALEANARAMLARTLFWLGDYDAARREAESGLSLARAAGDGQARAMAAWQLAMTEMESGRVTESVPRHQEALELAKAAIPGAAAMMRINLADAHAQLGEAAAAEQQLALARRDIAAGVSPGGWMAYADEIEARVRVVEGRHAEAAALFGKAAQASSSSWLTVRSQLGRARSLRSAGSPEAAAMAYRETIASIENTRAQATADIQKAQYMAANGAAYRELISLLWNGSDEARQQEAFAVAEAGRARALLDALRATGLAGASVSGPVPLTQIQATLAPEELLLEFVEAEERLFVFAVTRTRLRWVELGQLPVPELRDRVAFFRTLLREAERSSELWPAGRGLFRALLEPVLAGVQEGGVSSLVVSPDGLLHGLPLEALVLTDLSGAPRFLGERFVVSYVPSASFLARARPSTVDGLRPLLVIGNPPGPGPGTRAGTTSRERARLSSPLPRAAREASDAARRAGRGSEVLVGAEASETALRAKDPSAFRILHFATHAFVDATLPLQSGLWLGASPGEDGVLQAREIYSLELNADVVVLSACATGLGRSFAGEGVFSLARAFLHSGARSVVASLWEVEDNAALQLMSGFYGGLTDGKPVADAMAGARRRLLERGWPPRAWAGFAVLGPSGVRPFPHVPAPTTRPATLATALGLVLAAAAVTLWRRRMR